jgi:hypothetical protein
VRGLKKWPGRGATRETMPSRVHYFTGCTGNSSIWRNWHPFLTLLPSSRCCIATVVPRCGRIAFDRPPHLPFFTHDGSWDLIYSLFMQHFTPLSFFWLWHSCFDVTSLRNPFTTPVQRAWCVSTYMQILWGIATHLLVRYFCVLAEGSDRNIFNTTSFF